MKASQNGSNYKSLMHRVSITRPYSHHESLAFGTWYVVQLLRFKYRFKPFISGLDMYLDTPMETLHTILLGIIKYLWGQSVFVMEKEKKFDQFAACLRSIAVDGLQTGPVPAYIWSNHGSLNSKHFMILGQLAIFCLPGLVSIELLNAWYVIGQLMVLVWYSEIHDLEAVGSCKLQLHLLCSLFLCVSFFVPIPFITLLLGATFMLVSLSFVSIVCLLCVLLLWTTFVPVPLLLSPMYIVCSV
jgi:hypothetical protein